MTISICSECKGTGEVREDVGTHTSDWVYLTCKDCNGTGKIKRYTYTCAVPFDMDDSQIYDIDSEIRYLLRKMESMKVIPKQN